MWPGGNLLSAGRQTEQKKKNPETMGYFNFEMNSVGENMDAFKRDWLTFGGFKDALDMDNIHVEEYRGE